MKMELIKKEKFWKRGSEISAEFFPVNVVWPLGIQIAQ